MSNIVDDLLQDVEQLEASTQAMESHVQDLEQQKKTLNDNTQAIHYKLLLDTAKTTQEAAKQSQLAATTSIKMTEQLKGRNSELEEISNNWRQAVRNTLREQQTAKKYFAIMMGATLAVSIISLSSIGYLVYLLNQQNAHYKGEVLDIIQTESKLLSNKLIVKTDELASLTEAMSADIKRLNNSPPASKKPTNSEPKEESTKRKDKEHSVKHTPLQTIPTMTPSLNIEQLSAQHDELKQLIQTMLSTSKKVKNTLTPTRATSSPEQLKKLNDLSWLIRKQGNALKAIQKTLSGSVPSASSNKQLQKTLDTLKNELTTLNQQQSKIQQQLKGLQERLSKSLKKPIEKAPYSYKSTTDYKLD